jgi:hypothetical protein
MVASRDGPDARNDVIAGRPPDGRINVGAIMDNVMTGAGLGKIVL